MNNSSDDLENTENFDQPSRSQLRREALAVFDLAEQLVALTPAQINQLPLSEDILTMVAESRTITSHIARKRQLQFLAKHLRRIPEQLPLILASMQHHRDHERTQTANLHLLETLRDQLIQDGDLALTNFFHQHPQCDRQQWRQLVLRAQRERKQEKPPSAAREIFRKLRELHEQANLK